ncbi:MAG TPA: DUF3662 and FHA domain-containing protein [Solirubrobacteraceae bacterium]|nr:DUF3662 and FHA domain-containing protein [Solirubrobacteraceae bacterium]
MSFLRNLESKIANLVEGTFSRAFSSEVRPIEIARKLAREMEEHKSFSVSRTYVPNEYLVYLSPRDRERLAEYEDALVAELAGYLLEHARRERLALLSRPVIEFRTDDRLRLGEFGIQTRVTHPEGDQESLPEEPAPGPEPIPEPRAPIPPPAAAAPVRSPDPPAAAPPVRPPEGGRTMVYSSAERVAEPLQESARVRAQNAILVVEGKRLVVGDRGATVGRSRQCEIVVEDPNVSRRHAELRPRGGSWVFTDLGSTNGSRVNGRPVEGPTVVKPGDEIELGTAVMRFELQ